MIPTPHGNDVQVPVDGVILPGDLTVPEGAKKGIVLFAHGSGSGRFSSRNRLVAGGLQDAGIATLLLDLLTDREERVDMTTRQLRFDIEMLATRLIGTIDWLKARPDTQELPIGLFGASTGAGAALMAAARSSDEVRAVVSRGGRPDLAGAALRDLRAPTLLIVGGLDEAVIGLNERAMGSMTSETKLEIVRGAGHLFEEPGRLERVVSLAREWFEKYLVA